VEKPIADTIEGADALIAAAAAEGRILQVGHTERYNPAVAALRASVSAPRFVEVHRLGVFSPRSTDIDVVLDLMIHDLDLIAQLAGEEPKRIDAIGVSALTDRVDIANARLVFPSGMVANVTASRISAQKVRKLRVFERHAYHSLDFSEQQVERYALIEGAGERKIEKGLLPVQRDEPLRHEIASFVECVRTRRTPLVTGADGRRALALAATIARAAAESSRL
jgi:predicted dehydrogenase